MDAGGHLPDERGSDAPSVLVIDPDADAREIARATLAPAGLRVIPAATGAAALAALREASARRGGPGGVALVVGELYVPAAGEPCALRAVKRDPALAGLSFLVYTAHVRPADREWAVTEGCDAYLVKPAVPTVLRQEVARLLGRARGG